VACFLSSQRAKKLQIQSGGSSSLSVVKEDPYIIEPLEIMAAKYHFLSPVLRSGVGRGKKTWVKLNILRKRFIV
jgi:hypothetical protein